MQKPIRARGEPMDQWRPRRDEYSDWLKAQALPKARTVEVTKVIRPAPEIRDRVVTKVQKEVIEKEVEKRVENPINEKLAQDVEALKSQIKELLALHDRVVAEKDARIAELEAAVDAAQADLNSTRSGDVPDELMDMIDARMPHGQAQKVLRDAYTELTNKLMLGVITDHERAKLNRLQGHVHWLMGSGNVDVI